MFELAGSSEGWGLAVRVMFAAERFEHVDELGCRMLRVVDE